MIKTDDVEILQYNDEYWKTIILNHVQWDSKVILEVCKDAFWL